MLLHASSSNVRRLGKLEPVGASDRLCSGTTALLPTPAACRIHEVLTGRQALDDLAASTCLHGLERRVRLRGDLPILVHPLGVHCRDDRLERRRRLGDDGDEPVRPLADQALCLRAREVALRECRHADRKEREHDRDSLHERRDHRSSASFVAAFTSLSVSPKSSGLRRISARSSWSISSRFCSVMFTLTSKRIGSSGSWSFTAQPDANADTRSEEHTSELQSRENL